MCTPAVGRMSIEKTFHGDLEATSRGQMLAVCSGVKGSAGYVAMEHVVGTIHSRAGSFSLQHSSTMTIEIRPGGEHFYRFDDTIADAPKP